MKLTTDQQAAWNLLSGDDNIFLTGYAGAGKSFLIDRFQEENSYTILASTGAAALLIGGSTFHSFFGLGAMQFRDDLIVEKALRNPKVRDRIRYCEGIIIDEISMLSGRTLNVAELIARKCRESEKPWGGARIIAVGDFAQLPPIPENGIRDWAFESTAWESSGFLPSLLKEVVRTNDKEFLDALHKVREANVDESLRAFLASKTSEVDLSKVDSTCLFSKKALVETHNRLKLSELKTPLMISQTEYYAKFSDSAIRKNCPVPEELRLKIGAKVMTRINDPEGLYANGSVGTLVEAADDGSRLRIELPDGEDFWLSEHKFKMHSPDGEITAWAQNFPVTLAYACTIHKSQGMTLSEAVIDLRSLWEPGQAYVALSRLKSAEGLRLIGWHPSSIKAEKKVLDFYARL